MSSSRVVFKTTAFERPLVTVDVVIFTVMAEQLCVLLVRRPESDGEPYPARWALPGGFVDVDRDASLLACAERKLRDKTGVAAPYLEQLGSWGDAKRDPRGWSSTHAYFALIPQPEAVDASATTTTEWVPCDQAARRRLAFDHNTILSTAIERLRSKVEYTSLPAFLLLHVQRPDGVAQANSLADALKRAGAKVEVGSFPGEGLRGHMEINRKLGEPDYPATPVMDAWLKKVLG